MPVLIQTHCTNRSGRLEAALGRLQRVGPRRLSSQTMTTSEACPPPQPPALVEQPIHNSQLQTAITPRFVVCLELTLSFEIAFGDRGQAPRNAPQHPEQPVQFVDGACAPQRYGLTVSSLIALARWRAAPRSQSIDSFTLCSQCHLDPALQRSLPHSRPALFACSACLYFIPQPCHHRAIRLSYRLLHLRLRTVSHKHRVSSNRKCTTSVKFP